MSERRFAAVTETTRGSRVAVASNGSRSTVLTFLSSSRARCAIAALAGAAVSVSFAPLNWWPLAVLCPAILMWLWQGATPRIGAWLGFWFNAGTFAAGTYWLYISIHILGQAPLWIAAFLMGALVVIMGLYHAALGYFVTRFLPASGAVRWILGVPAAWLLIEWWRGWFLSGFSWLSLGYSQTDTWLANYAPIAGVYGISGVLLLNAGGITALILGNKRAKVAGAAALVVPWLVAAGLQKVEWTSVSGPPVTLAVVQGNISQEQKWLDDHEDDILKVYHDFTEKTLGTQLIVWPESAVPDLINNQVPFLTEMAQMTMSHHSSLVLGILREDEKNRIFNSVLSLGGKLTWYDKDHLVPFAEFFPVPDFVRSWMRMMSLPYSDFTRGGAAQPPLPAAGLQLGTTVCYEDAYGSAMLGVLNKATALVNVTNDAWFAHSTARYQHFQIARMRAIEAGRYMIRAANNGISGVIGPHGEVVALAPEFQAYVLHSTVAPRSGMPPYARVGNWLIVILELAAVGYGLWRRRSYGRRPPMGTMGTTSAALIKRGVPPL
jgi:apolipoprotein N-acyltransferase